jgi:uncharacterized protein YjbI with pentapeptide repeats
MPAPTINTPVRACQTIDRQDSDNFTKGAGATSSRSRSRGRVSVACFSMNQPTAPQRLRRMIKQHWWRVLLSLAAVVAVSLLVWDGWLFGTGFTGKAVWDWLQLLIIPVVLAGAALWWSWQQSKVEREVGEQRRKADLEIAQDQQREHALQESLNRMSAWLLDTKLRESREGDEIRQVARAQTLTVLRRLDGERKGALLKFLYEAKLLEIVAVREANLRDIDLFLAHLPQANLRGADLTRADFTGADLSGADLSGANLRGALLVEAILTEADLSGALMRRTVLFGTILPKANLSGANLRESDLRGADLTEADFTGADLTEADLTDAKVLPEQLSQADSLKGATMPDGSEHE